MMYDGLLRVGLIMRGPGIPAGRLIPDPVSTVDLCSTIVDYAGAAAEGPTDSVSLRPLLEGDASRDFAYNEWDLRAGRVGLALDLRTVRTQRHRMTTELKSESGELYDLHEDPHEMVNRYDEPAYSAVRRELTDMIASSRSSKPSPELPVVGTA
jgi:arylsulfatase A-like enzyme